MSNLCQIPPCFLGAVISRNQYPIQRVGSANQEPRSSLPSSRCSQENAGIKEKPHRLTLRGVARKVAMSASSRAIHRSIIALGMSRMGIATAGCKKRPPSHSSTRTIGKLNFCETWHEGAHAVSGEHAFQEIESPLRRGGSKMGRPTGLEPATPRFTILCASANEHLARRQNGAFRPLPGEKCSTPVPLEKPISPTKLCPYRRQ